MQPFGDGRQMIDSVTSPNALLYPVSGFCRKFYTGLRALKVCSLARPRPGEGGGGRTPSSPAASGRRTRARGEGERQTRGEKQRSGGRPRSGVGIAQNYGGAHLPESCSRIMLAKLSLTGQISAQSPSGLKLSGRSPVSSRTFALYSWRLDLLRPVKKEGRMTQ